MSSHVRIHSYRQLEALANIYSEVSKLKKRNGLIFVAGVSYHVECICYIPSLCDAFMVWVVDSNLCHETVLFHAVSTLTFTRQSNWQTENHEKDVGPSPFAVINQWVTFNLVTFCVKIGVRIWTPLSSWLMYLL